MSIRFTHLSDLEWRRIERMSLVVGGPVVSTMLFTLSRDEQHAATAKFIQHEFDKTRKKEALLNQQGSEHAEVLKTGSSTIMIVETAACKCC